MARNCRSFAARSGPGPVSRPGVARSNGNAAPVEASLRAARPFESLDFHWRQTAVFRLTEVLSRCLTLIWRALNRVAREAGGFATARARSAPGSRDNSVGRVLPIGGGHG